MSGSFTGFSEDDIRKVNSRNLEEPQRTQGIIRPVLRANRRAGSGNIEANNFNPSHNTAVIRTKILNEKIKNSPTEPVPDMAKLNKLPEVQSAVANRNPSCDNVIHTGATPKVQATVLTSTECTEEFKNKCTQGEAQYADQPDGEISNRSSISNDLTTISAEIETRKISLPEKKLDLDEFQARQKVIEEQNRKRKELLTKALAVKTKQTQEEAQKLNEIRDEFKKLDALLSNDVKILRQQIEVASLEYTEAQKKYFKIEKEFLDSKLALHQKLERKEMLTEHLCTIIEKNEERKAEKLNELLLKLNINSYIPEEDNNVSLEKSQCIETTSSSNLEVASDDNINEKVPDSK